jgi:DNA-binding CsgD family transcriptional regulator
MSESSWRGRLREYATFLRDEACSAEMLNGFVQLLSREFPATIAFLNYDADLRLTNDVGWHRRDSSEIDAYQRHYSRVNPFPQIVRRYKLFENAVIFSHWIDGSAFCRTEFFNDYLRPRGERYMLGLSVLMPDGGRSSLALARGEAEGGDFTREDARRFDMLRPLIRDVMVSRRSHLGASAVASSPQPPALARRTDLILVRRHGLSPREAEVAALLAEGWTYRETAERLGIRYHTVNAHVKSFLRKLNISSIRRLPSFLE